MGVVGVGGGRLRECRGSEMRGEEAGGGNSLLGEELGGYIGEDTVPQAGGKREDTIRVPGKWTMTTRTAIPEEYHTDTDRAVEISRSEGRRS